MHKNKIYKSALLIIGNEILSGRTKDENINYMARRLSEFGIRLGEVRIIPDSEREIIAAVNYCRSRYDYVFTTGGIGPTHDDITADSVAKAFGVENVLNPDAYALLLEHYGDAERINAARLRMAHMPEGATLVGNSISKAPGFRIENVVVLAGVPSVMQDMFESIAPNLVGGVPLKSIEINARLPEGSVAAGLGQIQARFAEVDIGSYPYFNSGLAGTTLVLRSTDERKLAAAAEDVCALVSSFGVEPLQEKGT